MSSAHNVAPLATTRNSARRGSVVDKPASSVVVVALCGCVCFVCRGIDTEFDDWEGDDTVKNCSTVDIVVENTFVGFQLPIRSLLNEGFLKSRLY